MDAVIAGKRGEAEIGDDKPLRRQSAFVAATVAARPLGGRGHDVNPRLHGAERLIDRKSRRDVLVQRRGRCELAGPDLDAALIAEAGEFVTAQGALKIAIDHGVDQIAVADPKHVDGN